ncbi:hypothetical protein [Streptomyces sasae]|uniref:hypothetical protein n=1 Tax=Streptomyces sasae TaxID=1266772 RepID=UPI00293091A2|nr:hypothetical protein [Streptomyces sasae]
MGRLRGSRTAHTGVAEHFVLEFREFDRESIVLRAGQPDLAVTTGDGFVAAALGPGVWGRERTRTGRL